MNKLILIVVPIAILGIVAGLAFTGVINIPGITPAKPKKAAAPKPDQTKTVAAHTTAPPINPPKPQTSTQTAAPAIRKDPDQGAEELAAVWDEIDTPELIRISANWKEDDLVPVMQHMDTGKVAKLLDEMAKGDPDAKRPPDPLRASKLSKVLQENSSIIKDSKKAAKTT